MALADVWAWLEDAASNTDALGRATLALGRVVEVTGNRDGNISAWIDVGDPFCALAGVYPNKWRDRDPASKAAAPLRLISLTSRNCDILAGILASLQDNPLANLSDPGITFTRALKAYARAFARAKCSHLEATLLRPVLNERTGAEYEVEEMLEDAEARWDGLETVNRDGSGGVDGWKWAWNRRRWDEITNTWVKKSKGASGLVYASRAKKAVNVRERVDAIIVSSDTEGGQSMNEDEEDHGDGGDDVFAAIPTTTRYAGPLDADQASFRKQDLGSGPAGQPTFPRTSRAMPSFLVDDSDSETETGNERSKSSEMDTDTGESDFDWTQYNGRYHPYDRVSSSRSESTRPKEDVPKRMNLVPRSQAGRGSAPVVRPVSKPARVVSAPISVTAPVKRPRVVVELPLPAKRLRVISNPTRPRIVGDHNTLQHANPSSKPRRISDYKTQNTKRVATSTISRLCQRFPIMSSDDDRE
ncbi:hypothetical protein FRC12_023639 [Ceratobasidium sp. 428]|nr:hypothetical protein FRC12_023639 [Ceratobasidium sp. 428]